MPNIQEAGTYAVRIRDVKFEEAKNGMCLVLPGWAQINGEERHLNAYLYFNPTLISGGRNQGRPNYEVSAEKCVELGMSNPFAPSKIGELEDAEAQFVVEEDTYDGKTRLKVAFVNPLRKPPLTTEQAEAIWAQMTGGAMPEPEPRRPTADGIDPSDNLPF